MATINYGGETTAADTTDTTIMTSTAAARVDGVGELYFAETITVTPVGVTIVIGGITKTDAIDPLFSDDPVVVTFMARVLAARIESAT